MTPTDARLTGEGVFGVTDQAVRCRCAANATGRAGDVFLCHPFVVHTATWPHRGTSARMVAQPGVEVIDGFAIDGSDPSPVAQAIVAGLPAHSAAEGAVDNLG